MSHVEENVAGDPQPVDFSKLLDEQDALGEDIMVKLIAFNKSNQERRRNVEFLTNSHDFVQQAIRRYNANNDVLEKNPDKSSLYYTTQHFVQVTSKFNSVFPKILKLMDELLETSADSEEQRTQQKNSTSVSAQIMEKLTELIKTQRVKFTFVKNLCNRVPTHNFQSADELQYWVNNLQSKMDEVTALHSEIASTFEDDDNATYPLKYSNDCYFELDVEVAKVISLLLKRKGEFTQDPSSTLNSDEENLLPPRMENNNYFYRFPEIKLPQFDGVLKNWSKFRDLFTDLIHKRKAPLSYKLQMLSSHLVGKAAPMVLHTKPEDYEAVWNNICLKYENKKLLVFDAFERLFNQKEVQEDNSGQLRDMHDLITECLSILGNYGIKFTDCESVIVFLLRESWTSKIESCMNSHWKNRLSFLF